MGKSEITPLTLIEIFNSSSEFNNCVYRYDSQFLQAKSNPGRLRAILSPGLIQCIVGKTGEIDITKAGLLVKKELGTQSHSVKNISNLLYDELIKSNCCAVHEEENYIQIALSRCAYILELEDPRKWTHAKSGLQVNERYRNALLDIKKITDSGGKIAEKVKIGMLDDIGLRLIRQCHLNDNRQSDPKDLLISINAVRLLTAAIITSINYQNICEEGIKVEDLDPLTQYIRKYLLMEEKRAPNNVAHNSTELESNSINENNDNISAKHKTDSASSMALNHNDSTSLKVQKALQTLLDASTFKQIKMAKSSIRKAIEMYIATITAGPFVDDISEYGDGSAWKIQANTALLWLNNIIGKCMNEVGLLNQPEEIVELKMAALDTISDWHITVIMLNTELTLEYLALEYSGIKVEKESRLTRIDNLKRDYMSADTNAKTADDEFDNSISRYMQGRVVERTTI